jgi:DNA-3-methyladenine glycosylase II
MSSWRQQEYESKAKQAFPFMLRGTKRRTMYTLTWQPPYDWQWMFGFLGARAVAGIETVTDYYERSFACEGIRGSFA